MHDLKADESVVVAVRLPIAVADELKKAAAAEERTVSAEVRRLVRKALASEQGAYPAA